MKLASQCFDAEQRQRLEQTVAAAERNTACEIVPVIATCSGRYDRAEDIVGVWLSAIAAACLWVLLPMDQSEPGSWDTLPTWIGVVMMILIVVVAFVVGVFAATKLSWLRRLFIPQQQMADEVNARARQVFFDRRVHHTEGASGILLYVSLFESQAVVLGDQLIMEKLGQAFIDQTCQRLTGKLHEGNLTDAVCHTIEKAAAQLAVAIPRSSDDANELQDSVVVID